MRKKTWKKKDNLIKLAIIMLLVSILMTTGYGLFHDDIKLVGSANVRRINSGHDPDEVISGAEVRKKIIAIVGTAGYQNVRSFVHASAPPANFSQIQNNPNHIISGEFATHPTYIWYENQSIRWYSQGTPKMPQSSASMFEGFSSLQTISGLTDFDFSTCHDMSNMFKDCMNLNNLRPIQYANTSNVTNMSGIFSGCQNLKNLNYLSGWNVSNVTDFSYSFYNTNTLEDASGINNWNISASANFYKMFGSSSQWPNQVRPTFTAVTGSFNNEGTFIPAGGRSLQVQKPTEDISSELEELDKSVEYINENNISNEIKEDDNNIIIENETTDNTIKDEPKENNENEESLINTKETIDENSEVEANSILEDN